MIKTGNFYIKSAKEFFTNAFLCVIMTKKINVRGDKL